MPVPREKLRLTLAEIDEVLAAERTARVATVSPDGWPHVIPMWFVWRDGTIYINSLIRSRRTRDVEHGSPSSVCVDAGVNYGELRGVVLYGRFENADDDAEIDAIRAEFGRKYWQGIDVPAVRSHRWLKMRPERTVSWDFRKIPAGGDKRLDALEDG
ncbi:MAG TPA: pyridoxamine 5'-phosphate oxidase family protein [Actinomycetota bacterium]|nr:pyridoxamine 5'-phosphate oxidase family protein [Actinomycetota bacterium]